MVKKGCYEPDCDISDCNNPEHYNFICLDPDCDDVHCENHQHYDRQLLKDFQEKSDFSVYDHREEINYDKDVDISLCGCPDCADDEDDHGHEHNHEHGHEHDHGHEHNHGDEDVDISLCGCPDCADDEDDPGDDNNDDDELLAEVYCLFWGMFLNGYHLAQQ